MARTFDPIDRERLIEEVGKYYLENNSSIRDMSKEFGISTATIHTYINEYKTIHPDLREKIEAIRDEHLPDTIDDIEVKTRVLNAAKLCIKGYTMDEIANAWGVSVDVINDDLHTRLPKIEVDNSKFGLTDEESLTDIVNKSLKEHSVNSRKK